jgi:hypothetical protein
MGGGWKGNPRYSGVVFFIWASRRSNPPMTRGECDLVEEPLIFLCTGEFAAVCMGSIAGRARVRVSGGCGAGEMSAQEKRCSYVSCDSPERRLVANKFSKLKFPRQGPAHNRPIFLLSFTFKMTRDLSSPGLIGCIREPWGIRTPKRHLHCPGSVLGVGLMIFSPDFSFLFLFLSGCVF